MSESSVWKNWLLFVSLFPLPGSWHIPSVGTVDANFVNLRRILAEILDMAQDVAARVLADEVAEVRAQAHVGDGALVVTPFLDGDALEQDEAFAVDKILT